MIKLSLLISILILAVSINFAFAYCATDWIKEKSNDGSYITMGSGTSWEVDVYDRSDSWLWSSADDVIVCDNGYIIHEDDDAKVSATRIE